MINIMTGKLSKVSYLGLLIVLLLSITFSLPILILNQSPFEYIPGLDNDEFYYWHQILTFGQFGFKGGYYVVDETPAKASFSHFGPHGPAFPMFYGMLSKAIGWHLFSPILINIAVFLTALIISILLAQPARSQLLWLGMFLLSFWPIHLYMPTSLQETLHQSIALLIAGSITYLIKDFRHRKVALALGCLCVLIGAMLRFVWALALLAILFAYFKTQTKNIIILCGVLTVTSLLLFLALILHSYWASPYPGNRMIEYLLSFDIKPIFQNFVSNFFNLISINPLGLDSPFTCLSILFRIQYLSCMSYCIVVTFTKNNSMGDHLDSPKILSTFLVSYLLIHIFVLQMFFYVVNSQQEYRIWSPYLLMAVFILASVSSTEIVRYLSLGNLFLVHLFLLTYLELGKFGSGGVWPLPGETRYERSSVEAFRETLKPYVTYQPSESAWCNTIDVPFRSYRANLVAVPPGIGFSILVWSGNLTFPLLAKYILVDDVDAGKFPREPNLIPLTETPIGILYFNENSPCQRPVLGRHKDST